MSTARRQGWLYSGNVANDEEFLDLVISNRMSMSNLTPFFKRGKHYKCKSTKVAASPITSLIYVGNLKEPEFVLTWKMMNNIWEKWRCNEHGRWHLTRTR